jgi:hypothetical protein
LTAIFTHIHNPSLFSGTSGLAMSRSIGDWDAGEVGVIPDPMIDILDMNEIKRKVLENLNKACKGETVEIDPANGEQSSVDQCVTYTDKDVKIFAISATDVSLTLTATDGST